MKSLIHAFKYKNRKDLRQPLGIWMSRYIASAPELKSYEALVPVPLNPKRLQERGFNQAKLLSDIISRHCSMAVWEALERPKETAPQSKLGKKEREENVQDAFQLCKGAQIRGKKLLLVDDLCTTGSTLRSCARILKRSGAQVAALVLARQALGD